MVKDVVDAVKEAVSERLKNPILGAYTGFLIICNWKVCIHLLFGDVTAAKRIENIQHSFPGYWVSFFLPVGLALLFVSAMPYVSFAIQLVRSRGIHYRKQQKFNSEMEIQKLKEELIKATVANENIREDAEYERYAKRQQFDFKIEQNRKKLELDSMESLHSVELAETKKAMEGLSERKSKADATIAERDNTINEQVSKISSLTDQLEQKEKDIASLEDQVHR